jgi:hypothetical protein
MQVDGLGLSRPASLVRASGAGAAVDGRELAVLPNPHTLKEAKHVRLLLLPELLHVPASVCSVQHRPCHKPSFSSAKRPSQRKPHKFLAEQEQSAIINKLQRSKPHTHL